MINYVHYMPPRYPQVPMARSLVWHVAVTKLAGGLLFFLPLPYLVAVITLLYTTLLYLGAVISLLYTTLHYSTLLWGSLFITLHYSTLLGTLFSTLLYMCALYGGRW